VSLLTHDQACARTSASPCALTSTEAHLLLTGTIGSSFLPYFERDSEPLGRISVPTAVAVFPYDLPSPPRSWVERTCNVQHWTEMPRGGHFPAAEEPELLAEDIRRFFRPLRTQ
jgi:pimeloyl-ACP methyl ester carboxylesterase